MAMNDVGLVGFACATGLGNAAADFYVHLPFARWLVLDHTRFRLNQTHLDARCTVRDLDMLESDVAAWLDGLDAVFAIQNGYAPRLWELAKQRGMRTVLMVNGEWFAPASPDMALIDCFIAPTAACAAMLRETGFGDRTIFLPHPIDTDRFAFRRRVRAEVFLHITGHNDRDRKGTSLVLDAARRCPEVLFLIRAQDGDWAAPPNVRLLGPVDRPPELYTIGDIAIQPSRYEGVGLPILEAMASGLPTIVPDGPPMNEYPTDAALLVAGVRRWGNLVGQPFPITDANLDALIATIRALHHAEITDLSEAARGRMVERSWERSRSSFLTVIGFESDEVAGITPFSDGGNSAITPFPSSPLTSFSAGCAAANLGQPRSSNRRARPAGQARR